MSAFGRLDVVFNNAGLSGVVAPVHELAVADWDAIVRIDLRGIFLVLRAAPRGVPAENEVAYAAGSRQMPHLALAVEPPTGGLASRLVGRRLVVVARYGFVVWLHVFGCRQ